MSSLTWQIGRKSTEQHGCYESRSIKLNFSDSPAYYTTVLHKYNSPAVFLREDTKEGAKLARRFPVLATYCFIIGQATSGGRWEVLLLFYVSMEITPGQFRSGESGLVTVGERSLRDETQQRLRWETNK